MTIQNKIIRSLFISTGLLIVPFTASLFAHGWLWTGSDYIFAWVLFSFVSLALTFVVSSTNSIAYKVAAGLAVMGAFLLLWVNAAVGIIGDGPINLLYFGMIVVGIVGAFMARLKPSGMALTLFGAAIAQMLVPVIALSIGTSDFAPGVLQVFGLNAVFAILWSGSGLLFARATRKHIA